MNRSSQKQFTNSTYQKIYMNHYFSYLKQKNHKTTNTRLQHDPLNLTFALFSYFF